MEAQIEVSVRFDDLDAWWSPFELGVGPAGQHVTGLGSNDRARLRERCGQMLPEPPFEVRGRQRRTRQTRVSVAGNRR
ncbi:hypothetical protein [Agrococcus sp. Ld7]|uniref:hypothetical protein n=1 Tax=Agrococcus sp. Ld7 TaxID=649148 RepID=UPI0038659088